ncbi:MAG: protein jag [Candidatus Sumerlaeaceae bacterium]
MISIDISADTEQQALAEGLRQLGVSLDAVETTLLSSAHDDILPGAEPLPGVTLRLQVREDVLVNRAKEHLRKMLELIGARAHVEVLRRKIGTILNIHAGGEGSLIIGRNGQNLDALQVLVNRMVVHGARDLYPVYVDCEGYREKRIARLEQQAERAARRALREGVEVDLEVMSASERKIIHNSLKEIRGIYTISRGEGMERHIVVCPGEETEAARDRRMLKPHPGGRRGPVAETVAATEEADSGASDDYMTGFGDEEE